MKELVIAAREAPLATALAFAPTFTTKPCVVPPRARSRAKAVPSDVLDQPSDRQHEHEDEHGLSRRRVAVDKHRPDHGQHRGDQKDHACLPVHVRTVVGPLRRPLRLLPGVRRGRARLVVLRLLARRRVYDLASLMAGGPRGREPREDAFRRARELADAAFRFRLAAVGRALDRYTPSPTRRAER